jgi:hypothetical protein
MAAAGLRILALECVRAFGPNRRWVASAYYGIGLNDYARLTQYRYNAGVDITWYPRKYR